jgi:hypothetical protein
MRSPYYAPLLRGRGLLILLVFCLPMALLSADIRYAVAQQKSTSQPFASPDFERVWSRDDGPVASGQAVRSWGWGPAPGVAITEPLAGTPGGTRTVQYFDKARMELNSAITDTNSIWRVTTGLLVSEMVNGRVQTGPNSFVQAKPSEQVVAGDANAPNGPRYADFHDASTLKTGDKTGALVLDTLDKTGTLLTQVPRSVSVAQFIPETGHNIPDIFWSYLNQTVSVVGQDGIATAQPLFDWLYIMGYPMTEAYWCNLTIDGQERLALIQLFQRRVLTYIPTFPAGWQVQMGNAGQHYYNWRYGAEAQGQSSGGPGGPLPSLRPATGGFVGIAGDDFVYAGSNVKLKGTNYWLSQSPFVGTWSEWNGPRVVYELEKAHELGVNTVRIGIPYNHRDTMDEVWGDSVRMVSISPWIKNLMTQFLQIAASYNMKVIFVLFEWYDTYAPQGSKEEQTNLTYIQGIVGPFANDDRVLAWDLHNEPDFYQSWQAGGQAEVIDWLRRMAVGVRAIDSRHPITVGLGNDADLWYRGENGATILSFVDFAALHSYDAGALAGQIADIKSHTTKPLLLEEMGWPTALGDEPPRPNAVFDEPTQTFLYKSMLADSKRADIAGVIQWTLWDYWGGETALVPGHERFFGLVRPDGSLKPAADVFKNDYVARDLPSDTHTSVPLDTSDQPVRHR